MIILRSPVQVFVPKDFLLILLRELLPARPDMRLLLMSATLDVRLAVAVVLQEVVVPANSTGHVGDSFTLE